MSWLRGLLHVFFRPIRTRECGRTPRRRAGSDIAVLSQINVASHDCLPLRARVTYATCIHLYIRTSQAPWPRLSVAHRAASGERRLRAVDSRDKPVGIGPPPHSPYNQSGPAESPESPCAFQ